MKKLSLPLLHNNADKYLSIFWGGAIAVSPFLIYIGNIMETNNLIKEYPSLVRKPVITSKKTRNKQYTRFLLVDGTVLAHPWEMIKVLANASDWVVTPVEEEGKTTIAVSYRTLSKIRYSEADVKDDEIMVFTSNTFIPYTKLFEEQNK